MTRSEVVTEVDGDIEISHVRLHSPLPPGAPPHPPGCDHLNYLRYRLTTGPADPARADAIAVMQPGSWGGAYSLDRLARNVVRLAAAGGRTIEWWSIARRSDGATDLTGIEAAKREGDPLVAVDYYYNGAEVGGRRFEGFLKDREVRFVAEMGLAQVVRDQYELLVRELPDPALRRTKVFLGGHSLGGVINGAFKAWAFSDGEGRHGKPGYQQCAGFISIDTLVDPDPFRLADRGGLGRAVGGVAGGVHPALIGLVRRAVLPRTYAFLQITHPETISMLRLAGLAALLDGEKETQLHRRLPGHRSVDLLFRVLVARRFREAFGRHGGLRELRLSGEALLGFVMGTGYSPLDPFAVTMGHPDGAVAPRTSFPMPARARNLPGLRAAAAQLIDPSAVAPVDKERLYGWAGDVDGAAPAVVDLRDFARQLVGGPIGFLESYFPFRLQLDVGLAMIGCRTGEFAAIRHERAAAETPVLHLQAGDGHMVPVLLEQLRLTPDSAVTAPGYTHIDMIAAAARPGEPVSTAITGFLMQHIEAPITEVTATEESA